MTRGPGPAGPTGEAKLADGATGQGSNSVQPPPVQRARHPHRAAAARAGLEGRSRPPCQASPATPPALIVRELRGAAADPRRRQAQPAPAASRRPSCAWTPRAPTAIGVKLGRRSLDGLLVDFAGRVLERRRLRARVPAARGGDGAAARESWPVCARLPGGPAERPVAGLGRGDALQLGSWRRELDIPLGRLSRLERVRPRGAARPRPPASRCSARTTAPRPPWPSCSRATAATLDDFLYVFIGTAIGGGVVLGGDYHRGAHGNAGDIGLMPVAPSRLATAPQPERPARHRC